MDKRFVTVITVFLAFIPVMAQNTKYSVTGTFKRSADKRIMLPGSRSISIDFEIIDSFYPDSLTFDTPSIILFPHQVKSFLESFQEHPGGNNNLDCIISDLNHAQVQLDSLLDRMPYLKSKENRKKVIKELRLIVLLTPLSPSIVPKEYIDHLWWTFDGPITVGNILLVVGVTEEHIQSAPDGLFYRE